MLTVDENNRSQKQLEEERRGGRCPSVRETDKHGRVDEQSTLERGGIRGNMWVCGAVNLLTGQNILA